MKSCKIQKTKEFICKIFKIKQIDSAVPFILCHKREEAQFADCASSFSIAI